MRTRMKHGNCDDEATRRLEAQPTFLQRKTSRSGFLNWTHYRV